MAIPSVPQHAPERANTIREIRNAIERTIHIINHEIFMIVSTGEIKPVDAFHPVQRQRENAQTIIHARQHILAENSVYGNAMKGLQKRMYQKLAQHDFYIQRGSIQHRENIIASLVVSAQKNKETIASRIGYLINPVFLRLRYDLQKIRYHKRLHLQIRRIITEIESLMEDSYFDKMSANSRDTYHQKWKYYMDMVGSNGIELL